MHSESQNPSVGQSSGICLVRREGSLIVYRTRAGWEAAQPGLELRARHGIFWEELGPEALHSLDPALTPALHRGVLLPGNGHTVDPYALVSRLAATLVRRGGRLLTATATGFALDGERLHAVATDAGPIPADAAVLAAGIHSRGLARTLGDRVPLESERGYHLMLRSPAVAPRLPTLSAEEQFVATPMAGGVRLTGTVELAGVSAPPDWRRAHALLSLARLLYPDLPATADAVWMGHRPSTPDSLPVIGRARRSPDVIYAFGHGHLGLTGAPSTGRLVAELIGGRPPFIDTAPFAPGRFRAGGGF